jgi:hypothetical protein
VVVLGGVAVVVGGLVASSPGRRTHAVESIFQDDQFLLYATTPTVARTLDTLRGLGVDRIRLTIVWLAIAPDPYSSKRPPHFAAANPAAYPAAAWIPYDRIVRLARVRGIGVDFNLTAPGPLWAMVHPAPSLRVASHYRPSAAEFASFVLAIGRRYSGSYVAPGPPAGTGGQAARSPRSALPRVSFWTIWNEPNQPGWLSPQWRYAGGVPVMDSPRLYRLYIDSAFASLARSGHVPATDTILIGELAPEGSEHTAFDDAIPPMPFLRALYCVDVAYRPLQGRQAASLHCPSGGAGSSFVSAHPALFQATGLAHHPYSFFLAPNVHMSDPNFAPLADLPRLEHGIDQIFDTYGVNRKLPIYLTEYGYETNPPNPFRGVSPQLQSQFLNQAEYLAWQDPRVRSLAQFLLYDSPPNRSYRPGTSGYWSSFQTGLEYLGGARKPSFNSYRLPIFIPDPVVRAGVPVRVWGMLRLAPNNTSQRALIEWRPARGRFRTVDQIQTSDPDGFFSAGVSLPGPGSVRITWTSSTGRVFRSRVVTVAGG